MWICLFSKPWKNLPTCFNANHCQSCYVTSLKAWKGEQFWSVQGIVADSSTFCCFVSFFLDTYLGCILLFSLVQAIDCTQYLNVQIFCFHSPVATGSSRCQEWTGSLECWAQWLRGLLLCHEDWRSDLSAQVQGPRKGRSRRREGEREEERKERREGGRKESPNLYWESQIPCHLVLRSTLLCTDLICSKHYRGSLSLLWKLFQVCQAPELHSKILSQNNNQILVIGSYRQRIQD